MFYGALSPSPRNNPSDTPWQRISKTLSWNTCVSRKFSLGGLSVVWLTDRRLASIEDEAFSRDGSNDLVVISDGFIYNHEEIARELGAGDHLLNTPELVAGAFLKWGTSFADRLNGDFAICIYREKAGEALFYRDHLGLRPLAVAMHSPEVYFSTDMMGLAAALYGGTPVDPKFLLNMFLLAGHNYALLPSPDVVAVRPGHYLRISGGKAEQHPYWFPSGIQTDHSLTRDQAATELASLLSDAVSIRADQRFTAASHVSGGLDSGVVVALVRKAYLHQSPFYGFSWSPLQDPGVHSVPGDERPLVEMICRQYDMVPLFTGFGPGDYEQFIADWRHPQELVFENKVVKTASDLNINLIFSGWGGDEFISIADRGIDSDLIRQLNWHRLMEKYLIRGLKSALSAIRMVLNRTSERNNYLRHKTDKSVYRYIREASGNNRILRKFRFHHRSRRDVHLQLIEIQHIAGRTADWYVLGQRHGIEYRYPLLDKRIVEYMLKVPSQCLVDGAQDRILIRSIGKEMLPAKVLKRRSKDDPAISRQFDRISGAAKINFVKEFGQFRRNPQLGFVDFGKMERDLPGILARAVNGNGDQFLQVFYGLKRADEFCRSWNKV